MPPHAAVDTGLASHVKVIRLLRRRNGLAAIGLWTLCLTWAHTHTRDLPPVQQGTVPLEIAETYGGPEWHELVSLLVEVRLWDRVGDEVWRFHDFREHQTLDVYEARQRGGRQTANKRWGTPLFDDPGGSSANSSASSPASSSFKTASNQYKAVQDNTKNPWPASADRFGEFYLVYPRRVKVGDARKAWAKVVKDHDPQVIIDAALALADKCEREAKDKKFIPYPATWLRAEGWADEDDAEAGRSQWDS